MVSIVGIYANSGLSGYQVATESLPNNDTVVYGDQGPNFPVQWAPRYAYAVSRWSLSCAPQVTDLVCRLDLLLTLISESICTVCPLYLLTSFQPRGLLREHDWTSTARRRYQRG